MLHFPEYSDVNKAKMFLTAVEGHNTLYELLKRARELVALCRAHGVLSIINDRADIALAADADGVHVGQTDLPARDAATRLRAGIAGA